MVIITNADTARTVFSNYGKNIAAFTLGKMKAIDDADLQISFEKLNFLPDNDTINSVIERDVSAKKIIKKAQKEILNPCGEHGEISLGMFMIVNMLNVQHKKGGPNVIVFVDDDPGSPRSKFIIRYLTGLFEVFGIEPLTKTKTIEKIFKKRKKAIKNVIGYMNENRKSRLSKDGSVIMKLNQVFYGIEIRQAGMSGLDVTDFGKKTAKILISTLVKTYSNHNLKSIDELGFKKKQTNKLCKKLRKKNKLAVGAYKSFAELMEAVNPDMKKLPKVKFGSNKKNHEPELNVEKFEKFFMKKDNRSLLIMLYSHTVTMLQDLTIGSGEYNKYMSNTCSSVVNSEFSKKFTSVAKDYAKSCATTIEATK